MAEQGGDGAARVWEPLPEKVNVLVTVFTYAKQVGADVFAWCTGPAQEAKSHPRIGTLAFSYTQGYPTDRCRNAVALESKRAGFHYVLMLDDDMNIDFLAREDLTAKPFLQSSLDFALAHDGPCLVGAPYCSAPPGQDVLIMKDREYAPDNLDGLGKKIDKYTRDEAAVMTGIHRCAALPTGCLLIDTRAFDVVDPPWFSYEYADPPFNTKLASTEDVVFTRNAHWLGCPLFANWDAWASHIKTWATGKPRLAPIDDIPMSVWRAYQKGWKPKNA